MSENGPGPVDMAASGETSKFDVPLPALRADLEISPQVYLGQPV